MKTPKLGKTLKYGQNSPPPPYEIYCKSVLKTPFSYFTPVDLMYGGHMMRFCQNYGLRAFSGKMENGKSSI